MRSLFVCAWEIDLAMKLPQDSACTGYAAS